MGCRSDSLLLDELLRMDDVSGAWIVWSGPAERPVSLLEAPSLSSSALGRGAARFRLVWVGGAQSA